MEMELRSFFCPECGEKLEYQELLESEPERLTYALLCPNGHRWGISINKPHGYVVLREPIEEALNERKT